MHDKIVRRMHEVFGQGLDLLERLESGVSPPPRFETEYNKLLSLLLAGGELDYDQKYRGDLGVRGGAGQTQDVGNYFLGVQYALACWLDEVFILRAPSSWAEQWTEHSIEQRIYGGRPEAAWRFWQQARKAQGPQGSPEALEAYLWAVMLGFRGNPESDDSGRIDLKNWVDNVRKRVLDARKVEFPAPGQREVPTRVPALRGSERLVRMLRVAVVAGAAAVFAVSIAVTKSLSAGG